MTVEPRPTGRPERPDDDQHRSVRRLSVSEIEKEGQLRRDEINTLLRVFYTLNTFVFGFVVLLWLAEKQNVACTGGVPHPLVTERVVLALIAASTAQLGAVVVAVGRLMFGPVSRSA